MTNRVGLTLGLIWVTLDPLLRLLGRSRVTPWDNIPHSSPQVFGKRVNVLHLYDFGKDLFLVHILYNFAETSSY